MNKLFAIAVVVLFTFSTITPAQAATIGSEIFFSETGVVQGTPGPTQTFSAIMKAIDAAGTTPDPSDDAIVTTGLAWGTIDAGVTGWVPASEYIAVTGFATYDNWGIEIYCDNKNMLDNDSDGNPDYNSYTGTQDPAGLVVQDNPGPPPITYPPIFSLPVCWRTRLNPAIVGDDVLGIAQFTIQDAQGNDLVALSDGNVNHHPGGSSEYFPWFFLIDKNTDLDSKTDGLQTFTTIADGHDLVTFLGSKGYHHAPGDINYATLPPPDTTYYVYFGANFTTAMPNRIYATNTITVEMYNL